MPKLGRTIKKKRRSLAGPQTISILVSFACLTFHTYWTKRNPQSIYKYLSFRYLSYEEAALDTMVATDPLLVLGCHTRETLRSVLVIM
jgi:ABC-type uncharacterized transport system permease subunit